MRKLILLAALPLLTCAAVRLDARRIDYSALWERATPFHAFLDGVKVRREQWQTRFANAAIEAEAISRARELPGRRRILIVAEDRCSDSSWAVPYIAKLAAAVPERLEVRVIPAAEGRGIQSANLTPDGRMATPTVAVLDELGAFIGAWVERPSELQKWYVENKSRLASDARYAHLSEWYASDEGRTTVKELLEILERTPRAAAEGK